MKRIFALMLAVAVVLLSFPFALPVSAAETTGEYFNVLDYVGVNGTASTSLTLEGSSTVVFDLSEFFGNFTAYSFEITFNSSGSDMSPLTSVSFDSHSVSLRGGYVSDSVFRYRGNFDGYYGSVITLNFNVSEPTNINFCSFNVYTVKANSEPIGGKLAVTGESITFGTDGGAYIYGNESSFDMGFAVTFEYWRQYDFIDFALVVNVDDFLSVAPVFVSNVGEPYLYDVPLTVTEFENQSESGGSLFLISVRADLRNLDHVAPADSYLSINFTVDPIPGDGSPNYVGVYTANGVILQGQFNSSTRWYQVLYYHIRNGFNTVVNGIYDFSDSVTNLFDNWFNSLFEKLDDIFGKEDFTEKNNEVNSVLDEFSSAANEHEFTFEFFTDIVGESSLIYEEYVASVPKYLDPVTSWGTILTFCWNPVPLFNSYLVFLAGAFVISVLFIKR